MGTTAYAYIRFSTAEQAKGHSEQRQLEACRNFCAERGLELSPILYLDKGLSGYKGEHLEEGGALRRFIADVDDGLIPKGSRLLVENLDRLSRLVPEDAFMLLNSLMQKGIVVATTSDGREYKKGGDTISLVSSLLQFDRSHGESKRKADTLAKKYAAKREAAKDKVPMGNVAPRWLQLKADRSGYEPVPEKVRAVKRIFELAIDGYGTDAIARMLNEEQLPPLTTSGKRAVKGWGKSSVQHVLSNRAVFGEYTPMTRTFDPAGKKREAADKPIAGYFPVVIKPQIYRRAQRAIENRRSAQATKQPGNFNVWSKVAKCIHCGSALHMVNKGRPPKGRTYLECSLGRMGLCKEHKLIRLDHSEEVFALMLGRLDSMSLVKASGAALARQVEELEGELVLKQQSLDDLSAMLLDPATRSNAVAVAAKQTEDEIADLKKERDRVLGDLAAENAIGFDTFMKRLDLVSYAGRHLANDLLQNRLGVLVFIGRDGFVVTQQGRILFGLGYDENGAGYRELSAWASHRPKASDPLHRQAATALKHMGPLHGARPVQAGVHAFAAEEEWNYRQDEQREDEGVRLSETEAAIFDRILSEPQPTSASRSGGRRKRQAPSR